MKRHRRVGELLYSAFPVNVRLGVVGECNVGFVGQRETKPKG